MGVIVFGNEFFDQWLNQKSNEILAKVEREKISNEDMLILSLKAQVNHFHHMDIEFRDEFKKITPHVESAPGSIITMDQNAPFSEYDVQWTIRHADIFLGSLTATMNLR